MSRPTVSAVGIADIRAAQARLGGIALRSPLVPCFAPHTRCEVHLKLDNLQPTGSYIDPAARAGFVSGVGFHSLLPEMWPLAQEVTAGAMTVPLAEVAVAIRPPAKGNKVIAEGARAIPVAAALSNRHAFRRVCAVVSGGNLDVAKLCTIWGARCRTDLRLASIKLGTPHEVSQRNDHDPGDAVEP